jgi:hypothetical protein
MSRRFLFVPTIALAFLAACEKDQPGAATPIEPAPAPAATLAPAAAPNASAAAYSALKKSSVCRGYENKRTALTTAIAKASANAPGLAQQKARVAALDVIIKDACQ